MPFTGLDFALLEANKARAGALQEEEADAALEEAFVEAASSSTKTTTDGVPSPSTLVPKKRTREEAIAQLKRMRAEEQGGSLPAEPSTLSDIEALERAKKMGKFRPIGAPPPEPSKSSSKATEQGEKRKKKKRKVVIADPPPKAEGSTGTTAARPDTAKSPPPVPNTGSPTEGGFPPTTVEALERNIQASSPPKSPRPADKAPPPPPTATTTTTTASPAPPVPSSVAISLDDSDIDIFAGAGDYEGLDLSDDDDGDANARRPAPLEDETQRDVPMPRWFDDDDIELPPKVAQTTLATTKPKAKSPSPGPSRLNAPRTSDGAEEDASPRLVRLQPLATSTLPSIKDLLEIDKAAEALEKKKARKEKNKAKSGAGGAGTGEPVEPKKKTKLGSEAKLNRDYQQCVLASFPSIMCWYSVSFAYTAKYRYTSYIEKKGKAS